MHTFCTDGRSPFQPLPQPGDGGVVFACVLCAARVLVGSRPSLARERLQAAGRAEKRLGFFAYRRPAHSATARGRGFVPGFLANITRTCTLCSVHSGGVPCVTLSGALWMWVLALRLTYNKG